MSTDSTCSITSCSICSNSSDDGSDGSDYSSDVEESTNNPHSSDSNEFRPGSPAKPLKKSLSAEILNHPPLPRFPRYDVKRFPQCSNEMSISAGYVPQNPQASPVERSVIDDLLIDYPVMMTESAVKTTTNMKKKNASMSNLTSELTFQNLSKFNYSSMDEFNNNPTISTGYHPLGYSNQQLSVIDIVPKPGKIVPDLDQTIGIPLTFDTVDNTGNAFYPSLGPQYSVTNNNHDVSNDYEYHQVPTTIHQYPLISGTIPSTTQAKISFSSLPTPMNLKNSSGPTGSILTNPNNPDGSKRESGEKNKVKFSDTITVAVVPEINRKEKNGNFGERIKRKTYMMDPRRELAESLPLCHPNDDYLKDFSPVVDRERFREAPSTSKPNEDKKKPAIKVVHFGVV